MLDTNSLIYFFFRWAYAHPNHFVLLLFVLVSAFILKELLKNRR